MKKTWIAMATVAVLLLSACAQETDEAASPVPSGEDPCAVENLPVMEPGTLTIATDSPAYPPWFEKNDPTNGQGYEGAVAYAVADALGFGPEDVKWVVEPFNKSYAPGSKDFDFDINQISITAKRANAVDFSDGYYDVNQALIALKTSPVAGATTIAELADAKLGAQVGTTSLAYIQENIQPTQQPYVYDTTNDAKSALEAGQIDGIVVTCRRPSTSRPSRYPRERSSGSSRQPGIPSSSDSCSRRIPRCCPASTRR
jgi:polar amino acid transport system substrate-binding protein